MSNPEVRLDLGRLPIAGPLLIGREAELAHLDAAWENPETHVLTFVAFGGMGKSALVSHWMDRMAAGWRGARRVLEWSFYSQGTEERVTSADRFLDHALGWFGDPDPKAGAPRDRGLRLAELVRREKTLLVLDGIEPLQHPSTAPLAGRLKDPGLAALLKNLAGANLGLCVVTTREHIADLDRFPRTAPQENLEALSPEAGAELLKQLGVEGKESELRAAAEEFGSHALTLTLLGTYLKDICNGDIRRRHEVPILEEEADETGHARRVIASYTKVLDTPEVEVLRLLGLFDRPAKPARLKALREEPPILGLTGTIGISQETRFRKAVSRLRRARLLAESGEDLDAHPLVRVFFQKELETQAPEAWRDGNLRLYEHLQKEAPDLPNTLEAMEPLYSAVVHGCRAGRHLEALDEVYSRRIQRGDKSFSFHQLGAFGSDLSALSGFFVHPWDQPLPNLAPADQALLVNKAVYCLRALGRLAEAGPPMMASLEAQHARQDWQTAARLAYNLSEMTLTLGEVERAVTLGRQSVDLADRSRDRRIVSRTILADALHQMGRWEESANIFREAETIQAKYTKFPKLYSLGGSRYCDLLLSLAEPDDGAILDGLAVGSETTHRFRMACWEVRERAEQTLGWAREHNAPLLDIAFDHLSLGRANLGLALTAVPGEDAKVDFAHAAKHLNHAVEFLRQANHEDDIPHGLLARATLRRLRGDFPAAKTDLEEALEIAERGPMRLHECDAHLEWARLCRDLGDRTGMDQHVTRARKLIDETGYERRRREVVYLEKRLAEMPEEEPMKDFFVSFNKNDRDWARWIAWTLEEAGYSVIYQEWDFLPGQDFILKMQEAASNTRKTVMVLSDSYLQADFTQPEWTAAFAQDPRGDKRKLIAFRVAPCSPPGMLATRIYADLVGLPVDEAKAAILRGVSDEPRAKPVVAPPFPGTTATVPAPPSFPGVSPTAAANPGSGALALWREKLELLLKSEAIASDTAQKFTLQQQIKEAKEKIRELGG